jgi:hypothetical protein
MTDKNKNPLRRFPAGTVVREAQADDDAHICALIRRNFMSGRISLTTDCEPSFFSAIDVEGYARRIAVAQSDHEIVGVASMAKRRIFFNGEPEDCGYLGSLRIDSSFRNTTILARFYNILKKWHKEDFGVRFYLSAIPQDNMIARNTVTRGRAGMPVFHNTGILYNAAILLFKRSFPRLPDRIRIVRGTEVGANNIADFLNRVGREKQFFPVYSADDILAAKGILRGLCLDDFYVALKDEKITGITACWNQFPFRRIMIVHYPWYLQWLKRVSFPLAKILHMAPIPRPGEPLCNASAACIAIEDNNPQIFDLLLNTILHHEYNAGKTFLVVGLMTGDPLMRTLQNYLHIATRTCIYVMSLDGFEISSEMDGRIPYVEIGCL